MANNSGVVGVLRALLTADTGQFDTSMRKSATVADTTAARLAGLGKEVQKLTPQAERMVKAFSGDRLFTTANNLAAAIGKIGGSAKLSDAAQARANRTFAEAIQITTRLGGTAPKAWMDLEKATRATDVTTKGFGSTIQGLGARFATVFAGFFTAQAAFSLLRTGVHALVDELKLLTIGGAGVGDVAENFERLTTQAGRLGSTLLGTLRAGTHNTIDDFTLMKTVNEQFTAGLRLTDAQFGILAKGSFVLAQRNATSVSEALQTMNEALLTGRTRSLAAVTGKIDLEKAEQKFAASLGRSRDNLTDEGKLQAARVAILDAVAAATARLGDQTDGLDERVAQATTFWANFQNELGKTVATSPVIEAGMLGIKDALQETFGVDQQHLIVAIAEKIDDAAIAVIDLAKVGVSSAGLFVKGWFAVNKLLGDTAQIADGVRLALLAAQQSAALGTADWANWKKLDDQIADLELKMVERGKLLKSEDASQAGVDKTTAGYLKTLDGLKAKMEAAKIAAAAHAQATKISGLAVKSAGDEDARRSDLLKASSAELAEQKRQLDIYGQAFKTWADAIVGIRRQVASLNDEQRELIATGLDLGLSINEITAGLKKQYPALVIGTAAIDAYTTGLKNAAEMRSALMEDVFGGEAKIFSGVPAMLAAESAARSDLAKDQLQSQQENAAILNTMATRRGQFEIDAAKRAGASWQQVYVMERQLAEAALQATLASIEAETAARQQEVTAIQAAIATANAAGFDTTPEQERSLARAQALVESQQQLGRLKSQQAVQDFNLAEAEKQDAIRRTYNLWVRTWDSMRSTAEGTIGAIADGFAQIEHETVGKLGTLLFGFGHDQSGDLKRAATEARLQYLHIANSGKATAEELGVAFRNWHDAEDRANFTFGERFKEVWRSVKTTIQDILNDILKYFTEQFLVGLIKGISGAKLGQQLGGALAAGMPMAGGGGLTSGLVQGGVNSVNPLGGNQNALLRLLGIGGGGAGVATTGAGAAATLGTSAGVAAGVGAGAVAVPPTFLAAAPALGATEAGVIAGSSSVPGAAGGGSFLANPAFWTNPWTIGIGAGIALGAVAWKKGWFGLNKGGRANNARDKDLAQFAAFDTKRDPNNPPGFYGLSALLTKYKKHELFDPFVRAGNPKDVKKAFQPIQAFMATLGRSVKSYNLGGFVPPGVVQPAILHGGMYGEDIRPRGPQGPQGGSGMQIVNHWHVSTIDAHGVREFVQSGEFTHHLGNAFERNQNYLTTKLSRALG